MTRVAAYLSVTWYPHPHPVSPQPSTQGRPPLPHLSSPLAFPVSSSATPTLAPPEVSGFCGFLFMFCFTVSFSFLLLEFLLSVQSWAGLCTCRPYFYLHMICALQYNTIQIVSAQRIKFVFWIVIHVKHVDLHDACMWCFHEHAAQTTAFQLLGMRKSLG